MGSWERGGKVETVSVNARDVDVFDKCGGWEQGSVECGVPYRSFAVFSTSHSDLHLPKLTELVQPVLFMRGVIVNYNLGDVI